MPTRRASAVAARIDGERFGSPFWAELLLRLVDVIRRERLLPDSLNDRPINQRPNQGVHTDVLNP
jgi:hypothetical protein